MKNQSGFTLTEVLVTTALVGASALALSTMTVNNVKSMRSLASKNEAESVFNGIQLVLGSKNTCAPAFGSIASWAGWTGTINVPSLTGGTETLIQIDTPKNGLIPRKIEITKEGEWPVRINTAAAAAPPAYADMTQYLAKFSVGMERQKIHGTETNVGGDILPVRDFYVSMIVRPDGTLHSCFGGTQNDLASFPSFCQDILGGAYDPTKSPKCLINQLAISGSFAARDAALTPPQTGSVILPDANAQLVMADPTARILLGTGSIPASYTGYNPRAFFQAAPGPLSYALIAEGPVKVTGELAAYSNINANGPVNAPAFNTTSDLRLKSDIRGLEDPLAKILKLRPVSYLKRGAEGREIGLIAQEVQTVIPEVVSVNKDGYRSLAYANLISPAIGAIQELFARTEGVSADLEEMKAEMKRLREDVSRLQKENEALKKAQGSSVTDLKKR